jgi:hypothetical protein
MIGAEWVKFRTVRGWILAAVIAAVAIAGFGIAGGAQGSCNQAACTQLVGPGGEAVSRWPETAPRRRDAPPARHVTVSPARNPGTAPGNAAGNA